MQYNVESAADELMLTSDDLKEIFDIYFNDAIELIASCYTANSERDYSTVAKKIHALKGSTMNLRMHEMTKMVIELQNLANKEDNAEITLYLPKVEDKLARLSKEISAFYHRSI